jgi:hypothetical protein
VGVAVGAINKILPPPLARLPIDDDDDNVDDVDGLGGTGGAVVAATVAVVVDGHDTVAVVLLLVLVLVLAAGGGGIGGAVDDKGFDVTVVRPGGGGTGGAAKPVAVGDINDVIDDPGVGVDVDVVDVKELRRTGAAGIGGATTKGGR